MADDLLTTIGISAKADTTQAVKGLEALVKTLERLQSVTKGAGNINIGDSLASFSSAMASFKPISAGVIPKALPERLEALGRALDSFDTTKLREISSTLAQIGIAGNLSIPVLASVGQAIQGTQAPALADITKDSTTATGALTSLEVAIRQVTDAIYALGREKKRAKQATEEENEEEEKSVSVFQRLGAKISSVTARVNGFFSALKRIAVYRAIRFVLKEITQGFREGIQNMYQYSLLINGTFKDSMDRLSTSALYLKNSLGAMVAPIINYITPAIEILVDAFVDLLNIINETIATLTGADTWTRALKYPKQYAEAMDGANGSAKALRATLLGFDEINRLDDNNRGSRGRASDLLDYSKMFEEVATKKLGDFWEQFVENGKGKFTLLAGSLATILALKLSGAFESVVTGSSATSLVGKFGAILLASYGGFRLGNWLYNNNVFGLKTLADDLMENGLGDFITELADSWEDFKAGVKKDIKELIDDWKIGWGLMHEEAIKWGDKIWDAWDWLWEDHDTEIHFHTSVDTEAFQNFISQADRELQQIKSAHAWAFDFTPTGTGTTVPYSSPNSGIYKQVDDITQQAKTATNTLNTATKKLESALSGLGNIKLFASGGTPETGSLFFANEGGVPELVGQVGHKTQVANNDQITESIKIATMEGNAEGNALLRQAVNLLNGIYAKDNVVVANVTTDSITSGLDRQNRRNGRTTVPVGV